MIRNKFYYSIKPWLPPQVRVGIRGWWARRQLGKVAEIWPVNPITDQPPIGWSGWQDGKKFAVVLTHDVEGSKGMERCESLLNLEKSLGFRSVFNFVPEGEYAVSASLISKIKEAGFEVGVHDLRHDGKLYRSRQEFKASAQRINECLKAWGAQGFRSGFMHHNLDWLQDLDVLYDSSTFDTDPFEPQPDGVGTIFPFWVRGTEGRPGYMELPYTLPQDSTLFLILKEKNIDVWKRKLDWVAARGGMVLVNTHPDYMNFDGRADSLTFPAKHYAELLQYISSKYAGQFYHALPHAVAAYCAMRKPIKHPAQAKRVCMISHSSYESDNRVMRYAEALAGRGDLVDIVALKRDPNQLGTENLRGVQVHRVQTRARKDQQGKSAYLVPVLKFFARSSAWVTRSHWRKRYDVIHVHNVPDFLVFAAWLPKLTGAKIVLDIHDIVPEFFASKFKSSENGMLFRLLVLAEKLSAGFANHVIISNHLWQKKIEARSVPSNKCSVFVNHVDQAVFHDRPRIRRDKTPLVLFPGGLQWHQGLDIGIRAFKMVVDELPEAQFHIYGDGNQRQELIQLTKDLGLESTVRFFDPLPMSRIAEVMCEADLGIVPKRADSFGNEAYSTKIMEFMASGVPVVISRTKIDSFYFTENEVRFFESGNERELALAILSLLKNPEERDRLTRNADEYVRKNSWETRRQDYFQLIDSL